MQTSKQWKRMSSGKYIALNQWWEWNPDISDINTSLNQMRRFNGHHKDKEPLTVAQHSYLCMKIAETMFPNNKDVMLGCLVHDWPEAYYGDIATPFKKMMGEDLKKVTEPIDNAVYGAFLEEDFDMELLELEVKICDLLALDIERRNMWKSTYGVDKWPEVPSSPFSAQDKTDLFDEAQKGPVDMVKLYKEYS